MYLCRCGCYLNSLFGPEKRDQVYLKSYPSWGLFSYAFVKGGLFQNLIEFQWVVA